MKIIPNIAFLNPLLQSTKDIIHSLTPIQKRVLFLAASILALYALAYGVKRCLKTKLVKTPVPPTSVAVTNTPATQPILATHPPSPLTVDTIHLMEFSPITLMTHPPQYTANLTLNNGYRRSMNLLYDEAYLLTTYIPKENIKNMPQGTFSGNMTISKDAANTLLIDKFFRLAF